MGTTPEVAAGLLMLGTTSSDGGVTKSSSSRRTSVVVPSAAEPLSRPNYTSHGAGQASPRASLCIQRPPGPSRGTTLLLADLITSSSSARGDVDSVTRSESLSGAAGGGGRGSINLSRRPSGLPTLGVVTSASQQSSAFGAVSSPRGSRRASNVFFNMFLSIGIVNLSPSGKPDFDTFSRAMVEIICGPDKHVVCAGNAPELILKMSGEGWGGLGRFVNELRGCDVPTIFTKKTIWGGEQRHSEFRSLANCPHTVILTT